MYTIDAVNAAIIFQYEDEWDELCESENIPNPYDKIEANKKRKYTYTPDVIQGGFLDGTVCTRVTVDNSIDEMEGVSQEWLDDYNAQKDLFMCKSILRDFSWRDLFTHPYYGKYAAGFLPCSGSDAQCSMFCPNFGRDCSPLWR